MASTLTAGEVARYSRHLILPEIGIAGQERLKAARVLCIGAGGLGSPAALYLAAAGVGTLTLVDFDHVELTNLQRQILHGTADVGRSKLESARDRLASLNPEVQVDLHPSPFAAANAPALVSSHDVVIDGSDNFPTRYLVNDACVLAGTPNVYGSIARFEGQASVFAAPGGPCYRCLHPEPPPPGVVPNCAEGGVLGVLPGVIGTIQATEAIKLILQAGKPLIGRFLVYDALRMRFRELKLKKDPDCPVCGTHPTIRQAREYEEYCSPARPHPADSAVGDTITVSELALRMAKGAAPMIVDVRQPAEVAICRIPGAVPIPLGELPGQLTAVDRSTELVLHCKSGVRSRAATELLRRQGFARVRNLEGGILAWIAEVDPAQPKY